MPAISPPSAPAAPAAPAAAKPASAPAAAPKPAAEPKPVPGQPSKQTPLPGERDPSDYMGEIEDALDTLSDEEDARAEGRAPAKGKAKEKAEPEEKPNAGKKDGEIEEGEETDLEAAAAPESKEKKEEKPEPTKIGDLRTAYRELKKWRNDNEPKLAQLQTLEAKVKELETGNPPEVKALQERLKAAESRRDELEAEMAHVDYSKSAEFQEKFVKPYHQAWADALSDLKEMEVELPDGKTRQATEDDLVELANLPLSKARSRANELFGDSADDMMAHRREILRLSKAQADALEESRTKAVERKQITETQRKEMAENAAKAFTESKQEYEKRWPKMFAPKEGDAEGNALLEKGRALANRLFAPTEETRPKTPAEAIRLHAIMWQKIANHDRLARWLKNANARIKELETSLAEYETSDPNGGLTDNAGRGSANGDDAEAEIDALARKGV